MKPLSDPSRLLIVRNDRVGDLVMTLPTIEYVRRVFPKSHIGVLTARHTSELLQSNPHVDQLLRDDPDWSARDLASRLRTERFDAALVINSKKRSYLAMWLARIPIRVTWGRRAAGLLLGNRYVWQRRSHPPIHESEFALAFARRLKSDPTVQLSTPRIQVDEHINERIANRIIQDLGYARPLFGVHPGNYGSAFNWPGDCYLQLIQRLAVEGPVVVTGGPGERNLLAELQRGLPSVLRRRVGFYHEFSLLELCAALSLVDVLAVSNTGPMHLAGALGTPMVALFSSHPVQIPEKWGPFGGRCSVLQAPLLPQEDPDVPKAKGCEHMRRIPVEKVVRTVLDTHAQADTQRVA